MKVIGWPKGLLLQLARQIEVKEGALAQLQAQIAEERRNVEMLRAALSFPSRGTGTVHLAGWLL